MKREKSKRVTDPDNNVENEHLETLKKENIQMKFTNFNSSILISAHSVIFW